MISIIVPCFNAENTILDTVKSLSSQSCANYQVVLVDDGSTDNTTDFCDDYAASDTRIVAIHQDNTGLMSAWKRGVTEATGEYIAFCDSDDFLDSDFIERISPIIDEYSPDLIIYGFISEYSNGDTVRTYNKLAKGYYDETSIKQEILPNLFSDGSMQSELIIKSRCTKVFKKEILLSVMPALDDKVSLGEDELTLFASIQVIKSLFCMGKYCPYHYVRSSESMIGQFDKSVFEKINLLYQEMECISRRYSYLYYEQMLYDRLAVTLVYVKKYICKSGEGFFKVRNVIDNVRKSPQFVECIEKCEISNYHKLPLLFASLYINRVYGLLYIITKGYERIRGRDV